MPRGVARKRLNCHGLLSGTESDGARTLVGLGPAVCFASPRGYHRKHMFDVRRRQGWVVVGACSLVMFGVWNSHAGFGVFLPVLAGEFGWSRGAISIAPSLNLIIGGLIAFFVGAASDRYGPRLILAASAFFVGALFVLASRIARSGTSMPSSACCWASRCRRSTWFPPRRCRAGS
jgi:MFS family permease